MAPYALYQTAEVGHHPLPTRCTASNELPLVKSDFGVGRVRLESEALGIAQMGECHLQGLVVVGAAAFHVRVVEGLGHVVRTQDGGPPVDDAVVRLARDKFFQVSLVV